MINAPRAAALIITLVIAAAGLSACGRAYSTATVPLGDTRRGLIGFAVTETYCTNGGVPLTLDLYRPLATPKGGSPVAVWVHGGSWVGGDSTIAPGSLTAMIESALVTQGWTFASINYRLAPQFRWPAQIEDTKCAIRYLRQHAALYGMNPHRIAALGASAGGHLVNLLGLTGHGNSSYDVGQYTGQSSAVQAVVDMSGPADLTTPDWAISPVALEAAALTFGTRFGQATPALVKASPVTYAGRGAPPYLIIQGDQDALVPPDQSVELAERLKGAGGVVSLVMVQHGGHAFEQVGPIPVQPTTEQLAQGTVLFLERYVGQP